MKVLRDSRIGKVLVIVALCVAGGVVAKFGSPIMARIRWELALRSIRVEAPPQRVPATMQPKDALSPEWVRWSGSNRQAGESYERDYDRWSAALKESIARLQALGPPPPWLGD